MGIISEMRKASLELPTQGKNLSVNPCWLSYDFAKRFERDQKVGKCNFIPECLERNIFAFGTLKRFAVFLRY